MMHADYAVALAMLAVALLFAAMAITVNRWLAPPPGPGRESPPAEYGARTGHKTWVQFRVRYPLLALLFVAFDMEMVFMFPWAVVFKRVGLVAFLDMFVFIAILAAAIAFAWKEGALEWER
jgi:NADH:ubiquinone oxidoreductase subunit 3 (subunit A)